MCELMAASVSIVHLGFESIPKENPES
jgi:hypothetical protein